MSLPSRPIPEKRIPEDQLLVESRLECEKDARRARAYQAALAGIFLGASILFALWQSNILATITFGISLICFVLCMDAHGQLHDIQRRPWKHLFPQISHMTREATSRSADASTPPETRPKP